MQTRAEKRRQEKKEPKIKYKVDFIDPDEINMCNKNKTRDDLLNELIGYRNNSNIFDLDTFRSYQEADNDLAFLKYLIATGKDSWDKINDNEDIIQLNSLGKNDPGLITQFTAQRLSINEDNILQTSVWIPKLGKSINVHVVPLILRGNIADYFHHNLNSQHMGEEQTYEIIEAKYWWPDMKNHIKSYVKECTLCQYVKYGRTNKAPMQVRELSKPRDHLMVDFLGPIFGKYCILVIIDYGSGYTMLVPTTGSGTQVVIDAIMDKWTPIFGWFKRIESDFGPSFNCNLIKQLFKSAGIDQKFAEARNHRGIGKVERIIGFIQNLINLYNVELDYQLIAEDDSVEAKQAAWDKLKLLIPFIQQNINRRHPRFTQYSPNMLMFGSELNDLCNIKNIIEELKTNRKKFILKDYEYLNELLKSLDMIQSNYHDDWLKYSHVSKEMYDKKNKITKKSIDIIKKKYKPNTKILYYVGDRQVAQQKWRQRWSGPWLIRKLINDSTVEIGDMENDNSKFVSVDRIKLWNNGNDTINYLKYQEYDDYQWKLQQQMQYRYQL